MKRQLNRYLDAIEDMAKEVGMRLFSYSDPIVDIRRKLLVIKTENTSPRMLNETLLSTVESVKKFKPFERPILWNDEKKKQTTFVPKSTFVPLATPNLRQFEYSQRSQRDTRMMAETPAQYQFDDEKTPMSQNISILMKAETVLSQSTQSSTSTAFDLTMTNVDDDLLQRDRNANRTYTTYTIERKVDEDDEDEFELDEDFELNYENPYQPSDLNSTGLLFDLDDSIMAEEQTPRYASQQYTPYDDPRSPIVETPCTIIPAKFNSQRRYY